MLGLGLDAIRLTVCVLIFARFGSVFSLSLFKALEYTLPRGSRPLGEHDHHRGRFVVCGWLTVETLKLAAAAYSRLRITVVLTHSNWH